VIHLSSSHPTSSSTNLTLSSYLFFVTQMNIFKKCPNRNLKCIPCPHIHTHTQQAWPHCGLPQPEFTILTVLADLYISYSFSLFNTCKWLVKSSFLGPNAVFTQIQDDPQSQPSILRNRPTFTSAGFLCRLVYAYAVF